MRVRLCGRHYQIKYCRLPPDRVGDCDAPCVRNKQIRISRTLKNGRELEVLIHEMLHACDWRASEEAIHETAHDVAKVLWRLGYRKTS